MYTWIAQWKLIVFEKTKHDKLLSIIGSKNHRFIGFGGELQIVSPRMYVAFFSSELGRKRALVSEPYLNGVGFSM